MSDIICAKCGEPWDTTGGIHYSHSDLEEENYQRLLEGECCPCCYQAFSDMDEQPNNIKNWQLSVEHLSEGLPEYQYYTDNKQPKFLE